MYLVFDLSRAEPVVDLVRHLVSLESAAPSVDPSIDAVSASRQVRAPVDTEFVCYELRSRGSVTFEFGKEVGITTL